MATNSKARKAKAVPAFFFSEIRQGNVQLILRLGDNISILPIRVKRPKKGSGEIKWQQ